MAPKQRLPRWDRFALEMHGRAAYHNWEIDDLIRKHYELRVFPHEYRSENPVTQILENCKSHPARITMSELVDSEAESGSGDNVGYFLLDKKNGVSALTFDNQGRYLAAGTRAGCITVYDFESLYYHTRDGVEDQTRQVAHQSYLKEINAIKWNPADQREIACGSRRLHVVNIYDCDDLRETKRECQRREDIQEWEKGFSDVAFASTDPSCVVAPDLKYPTVAVWDARIEGLPIRELQLGSVHERINSIQFIDGSDDKILVGGGTDGFMCMWDLRGTNDPFKQWQLRTLLDAQNLFEGPRHHLPLDIYTIDLNPSNRTELAFHVYNGWSGIFDFHSAAITHIHRPTLLPPSEEVCRDPYCLRRSSWLSTKPIYMAPSRNEKGIFLLDFHSSTDSPYHVNTVWNHEDNHRGFMRLSQTIITCAAHPFYETIVAGTENTSLLVISVESKTDEQVEAEQAAAEQLEEGADENEEVLDEDEDVADVDEEWSDEEWLDEEWSDEEWSDEE